MDITLPTFSDQEIERSIFDKDFDASTIIDYSLTPTLGKFLNSVDWRLLSTLLIPSSKQSACDILLSTGLGLYAMEMDIKPSEIVLDQSFKESMIKCMVSSMYLEYKRRVGSGISQTLDMKMKDEFYKQYRLTLHIKEHASNS